MTATTTTIATTINTINNSNGRDVTKTRNGEWKIEKWENIKKLNNIKIGKNMK